MARLIAPTVLVLLALAACGGDRPPTIEELGRDVQERTLGEFNDGFRAACQSRGLGRFTGGLGDDVCECALRVQVAEDELVPFRKRTAESTCRTRSRNAPWTRAWAKTLRSSSGAR